MKKELKLVLTALFFLIHIMLASSIESRNIIALSFWLSSNDSVRNISAQFFPNASVLLPEQGKKEYSISLLSKSGKIIYKNNFQVAFGHISDSKGVEEINEIPLILQIPYRKTARWLEIERYGNEIVWLDLRKELCNKNRICENQKGESRFNCQDCTSPRKPRKTNYIYLILGASIFLISLAVFIRIMRSWRSEA